MGAAAAVAGLLLGSTSIAHAAEPGWELESMSVPGAWPASKGAGVTVAVVDTGIRVDHEALAGRAEEGPDLLGATDQSESYYGTHGTAMASHVLDVAPEARVLGLRAIRDEGDPDLEAVPQTSKDPVAAAVVTAVDSGAGVISLSLGSMKLQVLKYSTALANAISYAASKGVVVVAASGNAGHETNDIAYPANYPGVITVGAANSSGKRAEFSNVHSYVDLLAPGEGVSGADVASGGRSETQGTSSATAYASGVAALIKAARPELAPHQIEQVLQRTASSYDRGHDAKTGYGMINAAAALEAARALDPVPALLPSVEHSGPSHLGPGDDGTPAGVGQALNTEYLTLDGVVGVVALAMLGLGVLLHVSGRRAGARNASTAGLPGSGGPAR